MTKRSYRDLDVWRCAIELGLETYRISHRLPDTERFGLRSQIQRAAVSVPSNIAEGYGRRGRGEYLQLLGVSRGSLYELDTQTEFIEGLGYCTAGQLLQMRDLTGRVGRMLTRLVSSLER